MTRVRSLVALAAIALFAVQAQANTFTYSDFSSTAGLQLNGSAAQAGTALRLTPAVGGQAGSAFTTPAVTLGPSGSFSTHFQFRISGSGGLGGGADGLAFVLQNVGAGALGSGGGFLGYGGIVSSLAVEFDTFDNGGPVDPSGNHAGIDTNGSVTSIAAANEGTSFKNGAIWDAWVDYNGTTLEVRWGQSPVRPAAAQLSAVVNLGALLGGTSAFVGFTAGTGAGFGNHDILNWEFRDQFAPFGTPEPTTALVFGLGLGIVGYARRKAIRAA